MPKVNRQDLLQQLAAVAPGLAQRDMTEQSTCFVFMEGDVVTYNDEVSCRAKSPIALEGAVRATPVIDLLSKMQEEQVDVDIKDGELKIQGNRKRAGIRVDREILLPVDKVEKPTKWHPLPQDFAEAVPIVAACADPDSTSFALGCVHLTKDFIEGCDNYQLARYPMSLPLGDQEILLKRDSLVHAAALDMTEICIGKSWVHFRNSGELVLSIRRHEDTYNKLDAFLEFDGERAVLPGGMDEVVEKAQIFSAQNKDEDLLLVKIKDDKLVIKGQSAMGWYEEMKKIHYEGPAVSFRVRPNLLLKIAERGNDCVVSDSRLMIDGGVYRYVACLEVEEK